MSYAPILAAAFVLWPVMGFLGGQGYSPLLALAALPALYLARPKMPPRFYAVVVLIFLAWAAMSETWSPASSGTFVTGSLLAGDFAIRATSFRLFLTALFGAVLVAGALRIAYGNAQTSSRVMLGAFAVQGLMVVASAFLADPVLAMRYGTDPQALGKGIQNVARNANAFALVLPILVAYLALRIDTLWKFAAGGIILISTVAFILVDSQAAVFAVVGMLGAFGLAALLRQHCLRVLLLAAAAYVAAAPILMGAFINLVRGSHSDALPASFRSRLWSWDVVINKSIEKPFTGHGLDASKTWRETYASYPDWLAQLPPHWQYYPVVPGHPHNMPLQIWAETGMVGAILVGLALVAIAFALPNGDRLRADIRYAAAGLIGAATAMVSFSYNVWNDAFWASIVLAVAALILLHNRVRESI